MSYLSDAITLADTTELAIDAADMVGRCQATGLVAAGYRGLIAASLTLGAQPARRGAAWRTDTDFVNAVVDLETALYYRLHQVRAMIAQLSALLAELESRDEEHRDKALIAQVEAAIQILEAARKRLEYAAGRTLSVPDELGETYAAAYSLVRSGRNLPFNGRWVTAEIPHISAGQTA